MRRAGRPWALALGLWAVPLAAQDRASTHTHGTAASADSGRRIAVGAMAIVLGSHAAPGALGRPVTEGYLTQPMLFGAVQLAGGRLQAVATLNGEGFTLRRGEINTGGYGEGYVDRRHPHTHVHEVMAGAAGRLGAASASLFAGKGVVPFGTDDPMVRPYVKYPANHHLAQVMERVQLTAAVRLGPATLEGARFNGDEPEGPADWPDRGRALDSWSARLTWLARAGAELSASTAHVVSPEFASGQGLDHAKRSAALRLVRPGSPWRYALLEWGRTDERSGARTAFTYRTWLAEGLVVAGPVDVALRLERTERPEEDRLDNPYRSVRPLLDFNVLGRTRWDIATLHVASPGARVRGVRASPFVEAGWLHPRALAKPAAVDPRVFYDASQLWLLSAGLRVHVGTMRPRWGRYGAAVPPTT